MKRLRAMLFALLMPFEVAQAALISTSSPLGVGTQELTSPFRYR